jgi:hypothetical protein
MHWFIATLEIRDQMEPALLTHKSLTPGLWSRHEHEQHQHAGAHEKQRLQRILTRHLDTPFSGEISFDASLISL